MKQELFAQDVARGVEQTEAYINNYDTDKMQRRTITVRASELVKQPHVEERIAELREQHLRSVGATKEWAIDRLVEMVDMACAKGKPSQIAVNALGEIAKYLGYHAPTESNVNNNVSVVEIGTIDNGRANTVSQS